MKKILKNKIFLILTICVILVISINLITYTYSRYVSKADVFVVSNTGSLKCDAIIDAKDEYIEDNERYFYINVKNSKDNIESDTDIGYILTIENIEDSKGLYRYIDSYGNSNNEYKDKLEIEEHILNKNNKEERFKIRVKSENAIKTKIKYKVKINCYQKENTDIVNPYKESTLAYNIFENAKKAYLENSEDRTILSKTPKTIPVQQISGEKEKTLSMTEDDYGNSYYYRGNVTDNYLNFNNMCWRIVRIEGDGSIKLILYDKTKTCKDATGGDNAFIGTGQYGYKIGTIDELENIEIPDYENCTANKETCAYPKLQEWYNENLISQEDSLKNEIWNIGDIETLYKDEEELNYGYYAYFDNGHRLSNKNLSSNYATLLSKGVSFESYIGLLTFDEAALAGVKYADSNVKNNNIYLNLNGVTDNTVMMLLSPMGIWQKQAGIYTLDFQNFHPGNIGVRANFIIRPSITLKSGINLTSGDGTKENPYTV